MEHLMTLLALLTSAINNADSYKVAHWSQYPKGTEYVSSYIEARSSRFGKRYGAEFDYAVFFGLQPFLMDYLAKPVTQEDIDIAELLFEMHGEPFNKKGWQYIVDVHQGRLPIEVRALKEGTVTKTSRAMVEIVNTDKACMWLTSYVETALLRAVWYPTTVATKSKVIKDILVSALEATAEEPKAALPFMLHDFGARGVSSNESAMLAGMGHIVNFSGTDTVAALTGALSYYNDDFQKFYAESQDAKKAMLKLLQKMKAEGTPLPAFSVEASEHSTMTILGRAGEKSQVKAMIDKAKDGRIISIVSDSYDYFAALEKIYGEAFKADIIEAGAKGGRVVIRPDSGDPVEVILKTLQILDKKFGTTTNSKGFKVLPPYIRILQGDGIDIDSLYDIVDEVKKAGYSIENVVFGMGGGLLQKVTRDDLNFAQKASAACIDGVWHDVYKDPITADPLFVKKSKRGRLSTVWEDEALVTKRTSDLKAGEVDALEVVFKDGKITRQQNFDEVRRLADVFGQKTKRAAMKAEEAKAAEAKRMVKAKKAF
jgi:nicotinamide phosphoribosyltransferase